MDWLKRPLPTSIKDTHARNKCPECGRQRIVPKSKVGLSCKRCKKDKIEALGSMLTLSQKEHFNSILWLINGPLGCGKSHVLATAFIYKAVSQATLWVNIFSEQGSQPQYLNCMREEIKATADMHGIGEYIEIQKSRPRIRFIPKELQDK